MGLLLLPCVGCAGLLLLSCVGCAGLLLLPCVECAGLLLLPMIDNDVLVLLHNPEGNDDSRFCNTLCAVNVATLTFGRSRYQGKAIEGSNDVEA